MDKKMAPISSVSAARISPRPEIALPAYYLDEKNGDLKSRSAISLNLRPMVDVNSSAADICANQSQS